MKNKKILALIATAALTAGFVSCDDDEKDPQKLTLSEQIEGDYEGLMEYDIFGTTVSNKETIKITKIDDNYVSLVVPSATYGSYSLPSVKVDSIHLEYDNAGVVAGGKDSISGTVVVDGVEKNYLLTSFSVAKSSDSGKVSIAFFEQYGNIPATMSCLFEGNKK